MSEAARRVMIVEDEAMVAMLIEDVLAENGYEVIGIADNVAQAIRLATRTRPDLVLCDIKLMGGDSGLDVAAALKLLGIPCLFISGNCPEPAIGRDLAFGCLRKPFRPDHLPRAIEAALAASAGTPGDGGVPVQVSGMTIYR